MARRGGCVHTRGQEAERRVDQAEWFKREPISGIDDAREFYREPKAAQRQDPCDVESLERPRAGQKDSRS